VNQFMKLEVESHPDFACSRKGCTKGDGTGAGAMLGGEMCGGIGNDAWPDPFI
jgi:hypothetical protein